MIYGTGAAAAAIVICIIILLCYCIKKACDHNHTPEFTHIDVPNNSIDEAINDPNVKTLLNKYDTIGNPNEELNDVDAQSGMETARADHLENVELGVIGGGKEKNDMIKIENQLYMKVEFL